MGNCKIEVATLSKAGGRLQNQDGIGWTQTENGGYFALADGLGGHQGGALAAQIAVDTMLRFMPFNLEQLEQAFEKAHQAIRTAQKSHDEQAQMASTLVALRLIDTQAFWGHIGDARIYWFRDGVILHQSKDHSIPQLLVSDGEITAAQIRHHPDRNRLHKALGDTHKQIKPRLSLPEQTLKPGDVFLLCSDGFWEWVTEEQMLDCLANSASSQEWLDKMESCLLAQVENSFDNYSAIAVFC